MIFVKKDDKIKMSKLEKILGPNLSKEVKYESFAGTQAYTITAKNARFRYPFSISDSLKFSNKFLVFQVYKRIGENVNITLNMKSDTEELLKVQFLSSTRNTRASQTLIADSLDIPDNTWTNICFDLEYIAGKYFSGNVYKSVVSFEIMPTIHIRWVFAVPYQIHEENSGSDLPESTKFNGLSSKTILIGERREQVTTTPKERVSRIPIRRKIPATSSGKNRLSNDKETTGKAQTAAQPVARPKKTIKPHTATAKVASQSESEDEEDDDEAFGTRQSKPVVEVQQNDQDSNEEELELVYIDALQCYYCPSNQQYYQVDESKA